MQPLQAARSPKGLLLLLVKLCLTREVLFLLWGRGEDWQSTMQWLAICGRVLHGD